MNKVTGLILCLLSLSVFAEDVYVQGYSRSDGTYVQGHYRSAPDSSHNNNWSTEGNVNPYTGKEGTKSRDAYEDSGNRWKTTNDSWNTTGYGRQESSDYGR